MLRASPRFRPRSPAPLCVIAPSASIQSVPKHCPPPASSISSAEILYLLVCRTIQATASANHRSTPSHNKKMPEPPPGHFDSTKTWWLYRKSGGPHLPSVGKCGIGSNNRINRNRCCSRLPYLLLTEAARSPVA